MNNKPTEKEDGGVAKEVERLNAIIVQIGSAMKQHSIAIETVLKRAEEGVGSADQTTAYTSELATTLETQADTLYMYLSRLKLMTACVDL